MEFNKMLFYNLNTIFEEFNFQVVSQYKNFIELKSDKVNMTVSYDEREKSGSLYVGKNGKQQLHIDGNVMLNFFEAELKDKLIIPERTYQDFVKNLVILFNNGGNKLLEGDNSLMNRIEDYSEMQSSNYTKTLFDNQNLKAANKAWENGDYPNVIKYLDKISKDVLTPSLKKKYEISQRRLNNYQR